MFQIKIAGFTRKKVLVQRFHGIEIRAKIYGLGYNVEIFNGFRDKRINFR